MNEPNRWEQGRREVDTLLAQGRLQTVEPDHDLAEVMVRQAAVHLRSAELLARVDPVGAFQLAYDGARKALAAVLATQGLRPRGGDGAHAVVLRAVLAQLHPPLGPDLAPFDWIRRTRNHSEYPTSDRPVAGVEDIAEAVPAVRRIIEIAAAVIQRMPVY